jgi:hypothetical protein
MPRRHVELGQPLLYAETCGVCDNQIFWWRSRSGYQVCMVCDRDPFQALETLARRGAAGTVARVRTWWGPLNLGHDT